MLKRIAACITVATIFGLASTAGARTPKPKVTPSDPPRIVRQVGVLPVSNAEVRVSFSFYDSATADTPVWQESQIVATDADGRYTALLGASLPDGLPSDLFSTRILRWLGVKIDGGPELPRVEVASVPYALHVQDAERLGGRAADTLVAVDIAGALGVTTSGRGRLASSPEANGGPGGTEDAASGGANTIARFLTTSTFGSSVISSIGANVGINTGTPETALHVVAASAPGAFFDVYSGLDVLGALPVVFRAARGSLAEPFAVVTGDILGGLAIRAFGSTKFSGGRGQVMFKAATNWTTASNATYLQFTTTALGAATTVERMRIAPSGQVGIGAANPQWPLTVSGAISSTSGGLKFPDHSVQTAATLGGEQTVDRTAGGYEALAVDTGYANTGFGGQALFRNQTGQWNAAFGTGTMTFNNSGLNNAAIGELAAAMSSSGSFNTSAGAGVLYHITTGQENAAMGEYALEDVTTGWYNNAFGHIAACSLDTTWGNNAFGTRALCASTAPAAYNTAFGHTAGYNNLAGSDNTYVGMQADSSPTLNAVSRVIAIGAKATPLANNACVLGDGTVSVGIGTSAPAQKLDVVGSGRISADVSIDGALLVDRNSTNNATLDEGALRLGEGNTGEGIASARLYGAFNQNGLTFYTNFATRMLINNDGLVTIGGAVAPTDRLSVRGSVSISQCAGIGPAGSIAWYGDCFSDRRFKQDIRPFGPVLARLVRLEPVRFSWRADEFPGRGFDHERQIGLIAQDVERVFPAMVGIDEQGLKVVHYGELPYLITAAIGELQKQVETGNQLLDRAERDVANLQRSVEALHLKVGRANSTVQK